MNSVLYIDDQKKIYIDSNDFSRYFLDTLKTINITSFQEYLDTPNKLIAVKLNNLDNNGSKKILSFMSFCEYIRTNNDNIPESLKNNISKLFECIDKDAQLSNIYNKALRTEIISEDYIKVYDNALKNNFDDIYQNYNIKYEIDNNLNISETDKLIYFRLSLLPYYELENIIDKLSDDMLKYLINCNIGYSYNIFKYLLSKNNLNGINLNRFMENYRKHSSNISSSDAINIVRNKEYLKRICQEDELLSLLIPLSENQKKEAFNILIDDEILRDYLPSNFVFNYNDIQVYNEKHIKFLLENIEKFSFNEGLHEQLLKNYLDSKYNIKIDLNNIINEKVVSMYKNLLFDKKYINIILNLKSFNIIEYICNYEIPKYKVGNLLDCLDEYTIDRIIENVLDYDHPKKEFFNSLKFQKTISKNILSNKSDLTISNVLYFFDEYVSSIVLGDSIKLAKTIEEKDFLMGLFGIKEIDKYKNVSDKELIDIITDADISKKRILASYFSDKDLYSLIDKYKTKEEVLSENLIYAYDYEHLLTYFYENGIDNNYLVLINSALVSLPDLEDINVIKYYISNSLILNNKFDSSILDRLCKRIIEEIYPTDKEFVYSILDNMNSDEQLLPYYLFTSSDELKNDVKACYIATKRNCNCIKYVNLIDDELINNISDFYNLTYNDLSKTTFIKIYNLRKNDIGVTEYLLYYINKIFDDSDKDIIISFLDSPIGDYLIRNYSILKNDINAFIISVNYNISNIKYFDNSLFTLDNLKKIKNLNELNYILLSEFDSKELIYTIINNDLLTNYSDLVRLSIDYSKITNTKIYNSIFNNDADLFFKIYEKYPEIGNYVEDHIKGYLKVFKCNNLIPLDNFETLFDANGATEVFKKSLKNKEKARNYLSIISHLDVIANNPSMELLDLFEYYIEDEYSMDKSKFELIKNTLGPSVLFNLNVEKIDKFLRLPIEDMNKFFEVVHPREASSSKIKDAIMDSILQYEFSIYFETDVRIFFYIRDVLSSISLDEYKGWMSGTYSNIAIDILNIYKEKIYTMLNIDDSYKFNIDNNLISFNDAIIYAIEGNLKYLHFYCDEYVKKAREKYANDNQDFALRVGFKQEYDYTDLIDKLHSYLLGIKTYEEFINYVKEKAIKYGLDSLNYTDSINELNMKAGDLKLLTNISLEEYEAVIDVLVNKKRPSAILNGKKNIIKAINKFYKYICKDMYKNNPNINELLDKLGVEKKLNIKLKELNYMDIIKDIDFEMFKDVIYSNEEIRKNLIRHFDKYYLGQIPDIITEYSNKRLGLDIVDGVNYVGPFIMHYYNELLSKKENIRINKSVDIELEDVKFSFSEILKLISALNGIDINLLRLMSENFYSTFVKNSGPFSSLHKKKDREKKILDIIPFLYTNCSSTIPSFDDILEYKDKKINIISANRTSMINLCHGEKTGACMRLGGAGESLFLKCIINKNWFHVRFEDPNTHEYISRISGFRNGNSVFLNQLRFSSDTAVCSNFELRKYIEQYAYQLIEMTKTSKYPIENVFINTDYAMKDGEYKRVQFNGMDIKQGYGVEDIIEYGLVSTSYVYTDVENSAYLLATTLEGSKTKEGYAPIKLGKYNTDTYISARDKILGLTFDSEFDPRLVRCGINQIIENINRVHALKEYLMGANYEFDIKDVINNGDINDILDGYVSADWYVFIDKKGNVYSEVIENIKNDEEINMYRDYQNAQEELNRYTTILINRYSDMYEKGKTI